MTRESRARPFLFTVAMAITVTIPEPSTVLLVITGTFVLLLQQTQRGLSQLQ